MTKIPSVEEVKKMGLQKKQGQATVYCYTHTQLENILTDQRETGAKAENERCAVSAWSTGMKVGTDLMEGRELGARCAKEIRDNLTH